MNNYETVRNHLHLADETCERFKELSEPSIIDRFKFSATIYLARAVCAALLAIADAIYTASKTVRED